MSINTYEIFTKLTMINNASSVLAVIGKEVLNLETGIGRLQSKLGGLNATSLAVFGGLGLAAGGGLALGLKAAMESAKDLGHQLVQVQKLGLSTAEYAKARATIMQLPSIVPGTTSATGAKIYGEMFSILGADETGKNLDKLSAFTMSLANTKGITFGKAAEDLRDMVRSADLLRKFVDPATGQTDYKRLDHFLDVGARVVTATHGVVGPQAWLAMAKQGGPVLSTMTDEGLITSAIVAQYMGGSRAGTSITSAFQQFGGGKMTQNAAAHSRMLGLVGKYGVGRGGHLLWGAGALDTPFAKALRTDPAAAAQILESALISHGYNTPEKQQAELFQVLGRQTTQRLMSDLTGNLPQILQERTRTMGAMGVSAGNQLANTQDPEQAMRNFSAAWEDMIAKISLPGTLAAIPVMNKVGDFFLKIGTWSIKPEHAEFLKNLGVGIGILAGALMSGGAVAIFLALGPAGWITAGVVALGLAMLAYPDKWKAFVETMNNVFNAIGEAIKKTFSGVIDWFKSFMPAWAQHTGFDGGTPGGSLLQNASYETPAGVDSPGVSPAHRLLSRPHGHGGGGGHPDGRPGVGNKGAGQYNVKSAYDLIRQAGATAEEARTFAAIEQAESRGNPKAHNTNARTGDNSYGLWQINMLGRMGPARSYIGLS
jgi:Lysozyme like domain